MEVYELDEDSWLLQKEVEKHAKPGMKILDMGCGTGIQGITAAKNGAIVTCIDINKDALDITKKNSEIENVKIEVVESDLFKNVNGKFNLIIFNPPYLPGTEYLDLDGGKKGYEIAIRFLNQSKDYLKKGGRILLLISSLTNQEVVEKKLENLGFRYRVVSSKKLSWESLFVYLVFFYSRRQNKS